MSEFTKEDLREWAPNGWIETDGVKSVHFDASSNRLFWIETDDLLVLYPDEEGTESWVIAHNGEHVLLLALMNEFRVEKKALPSTVKAYDTGTLNVDGCTVHPTGNKQ